MVNSGQIDPKVETYNSLKFFKAIDFFLVGSKTNWTSKLICFYILKKTEKEKFKIAYLSSNQEMKVLLACRLNILTVV